MTPTRVAGLRRLRGQGPGLAGRDSGTGVKWSPQGITREGAPDPCEARDPPAVQGPLPLGNPGSSGPPGESGGGLRHAAQGLATLSAAFPGSPRTPTSLRCAPRCARQPPTRPGSECRLPPPRLPTPSSPGCGAPRSPSCGQADAAGPGAWKECGSRTASCAPARRSGNSRHDRGWEQRRPAHRYALGAGDGGARSGHTGLSLERSSLRLEGCGSPKRTNFNLFKKQKFQSFCPLPPLLAVGRRSPGAGDKAWAEQGTWAPEARGHWLVLWP